jgi:ubiquinone/menaquinone biosynthesis C-methylase UbiE
MPERELAAVLHAHPSILKFLTGKCPDAEYFFRWLMSQHPPVTDNCDLEKCVDTVLWSIADMLIYNKCPEVYDELEFHHWDFAEVTMITPLDGKVVVDVGAGTGRVCLEAARTASVVFAVEPVARLRRFTQEKAARLNLTNIFVIDGLLHEIPLPAAFADVLITSHALGWRLDHELREFERVVKKGGHIIHCPGTAEGEKAEDYKHSLLIAPAYGYQFSRYHESDGWKRKYWKRV